jgi:hypothetical protein
MTRGNSGISHKLYRDFAVTIIYRTSTSIDFFFFDITTLTAIPWVGAGTSS